MGAFTGPALVGLVLMFLLTVGAPGAFRAGLVVRFADGKVQTACVSFSEPAITGEQLLQRSGFKSIVDSGGALGGAICSINDQGCRYPSQDCFCRCTGSQCEYWAYYLWHSGAWLYSCLLYTSDAADE